MLAMVTALVDKVIYVHALMDGMAVQLTAHSVSSLPKISLYNKFMI